MQEADIMARMTFSIPNDLKKKLDLIPKVNWPEVFKEGIRKKLELMEKLRTKGDL